MEAHNSEHLKRTIQMQEDFGTHPSRFATSPALAIIQIWEGVLVLPLAGSLDTVRAQDILEALLGKIVETGSEVVILDVAGVSSVESGAAKSMIDTVSAARLLGSDVLIVGMNTRTALTFVHLGVDPSRLATATTVAKGMQQAFARLGLQVVARGTVSTAESSVAALS